MPGRHLLVSDQVPPSSNTGYLRPRRSTAHLPARRHTGHLPARTHMGHVPAPLEAPRDGRFGSITDVAFY
jgi:hypothetical protein